jgi:hypothetical protein
MLGLVAHIVWLEAKHGQPLGIHERVLDVLGEIARAAVVVVRLTTGARKMASEAASGGACGMRAQRIRWLARGTGHIRTRITSGLLRSM